LGLAILAPFSLHVYLKHEFPLIAFPILLAKGLLLYWLLSLAKSHWRRTSGSIAALAIAAYLADGVLVHVNNTEHGIYANFEWRRFVQSHPDAQVLLSTYTIITDAMMRDTVDPLLGIDDSKTKRIERTDAAQAFANIKRQLPADTPRSPIYWIYQPADRIPDFDAAEPSCRWQDWLLSALGQINFRRNNKPRLDAPWIVPARPGVGATLSFGGTLTGIDVGQDTIGIETAPTLQVTRKPIYNCIYQSWIGWAQTTAATVEPLRVGVVDLGKDGTRSSLYEFKTQVSDTPDRSGPIGVTGPSDPSIDAVIASFPDLPVVTKDNRGIGYVIFEVPN
jgi:hypothetical protein